MKNQKKYEEKAPRDFDWSTIGLDFGNWEEEKIWKLDLPIEEMGVSELIWLFDAPFWENDTGERYTVTPWDVINGKNNTSKEIESMEKADLSYPIDIFHNHGKWIVLDGLHRLAKAYKNGEIKIKVRVIPRDKLPEIASDYPIEFPEKNNLA